MKKIIIALVCIVSVLLLAAFQQVSKSQNQTPIGKKFVWMDAPEGVEVSLGFGGQENRFFGKAPVNHYFGFYDVTNSKLSLTKMGTTMMMGPEDLMSVEQQYLKDLVSVKTYKFENDKFYLFLGNGQKLVFKEVPADFY